MYTAVPKRELVKVVNRFLKNQDRGISIALFAELAGVSESTMKNVFVTMIDPLTETVQHRVSQAYHAFINGEVAVMQNKDRTKFTQYRKEPKPLMKKTMGVTLTNEGLKIKLGVKPKHDYQEPTLEELFERR